ncbi:SDR family oxidoreductase [Thermococcus sp. MAR1]|uniref:SDR family NAD(P)-dependent oxidoreductase n=1 Tax=Thermococcus sp. MAR1 TaxID=1638263 RepID=UPI00143AD2E5|nr:SDR family NAD(P)-dependent oxidoreductase [Thermococcus sp. MAR1]NJE09671.1 SDR family NAD(P)-dependent oxidoreductase [Thermococcus sp. MAR1]
MKTALITGATGGIGRLLVEALVGRDYRVIGVARNEERLKELQSLGNFDYIVADLRERNVPKVIRSELGNLGVERLDVLINNAGFGILKPLVEQSEDELEEIFRVNTIVPVTLTRELLDLIPRGGKVVMVLSGVVFVNVRDFPSYGASKAALHYLSVNLEHELEKNGITLIRVYPKQVSTPFWNDKVPKGALHPKEVVSAIFTAIEKNKREVFVPSYLKLVKYLPRWPVFNYRFKF